MPRDCISTDHFFSPVNGRLLHTYGCKRKGYTCGSLFVDHDSDKIFHFPQFSTNASKTIKNTVCLESMAKEVGIEIKQYHSDNGIFASQEFKEHWDRSKRKYSFGGVGAKHQNGVAERNIKTIA